MSTSSASRAIVAALPAVVTLADVLANIEGDRSCPVRQRQDRASAIRTLAKALGRQPGEIPAQPRQLQRRIEEMSPAMAGLTPLRWRNVLSLTRAALKQADLSRVPGRHTGPLSPAWSDLFRHLNDRLSGSVSRDSRTGVVHGKSGRPALMMQLWRNSCGPLRTP